VLLRAPYRLSFAYAGDDHAWKSNWLDSDKLPAKIRLTVRDASSGRVLTISTVTPIHVQSSAQGDCEQADGKCDDNGAAQTGAQGNGQQASPAGSQPAGSAGIGQGSSP
jgi:general secretion pathway protein J